MIELTNVSKIFIVRERPGIFCRGRRREIQALKDITLTIDEGEFVGLLGPNGAGKTTLLKIVATLLLPTHGEVRVNGIDVVKHPAKVRNLLGVVLSGERTLYWKLTARENLLLFAGLYGLPKKVARLRAEELLELVGLSGFRDVTVEKFSAGMRKRLAIARSLVHRPSVLLLDEPTAGLDPHGVEDVWKVLRALQEKKATILMATHNMLEAERIPARLVIIDRGRIIADGSPQKIMTQAGAEKVAVLTLTSVQKIKNYVPFYQVDDGRFMAVIPLHQLPAMLETFQRAGMHVDDLEIKESGLWEAFLKLTGRPFDDGEKCG